LLECTSDARMCGMKSPEKWTSSDGRDTAGSDSLHGICEPDVVAADAVERFAKIGRQGCEMPSEPKAPSEKLLRMPCVASSICVVVEYSAWVPGRR
jgi:hypothetical protein